MEELASPIADHVSAMTDASWVNSVVSLAGVFLASVVSWLIYRRNASRSDASAVEERGRHTRELARLKEEAERAEVRHQQQLDAMLVQGRRQREVAFLCELADYLTEFSSSVRTGLFTSDSPSVMRLRQYSLKIYADFSEDDPDFTKHVSRFLRKIAKKAADSYHGSNAFGEVVDWDSLSIVSVDAEKGAFHLLRWLDPELTSDARQAFENYRHHDEFERAADAT